MIRDDQDTKGNGRALHARKGGLGDLCFSYSNLTKNERLGKLKPKCGDAGQGSSDAQLGIRYSSGGDRLKLNLELSVDIHLVVRAKLFESTGSDFTS